MRTVFADTFYWISLSNPNDEWHETVRVVSQSLGPSQIVTTDEVLAEFLTFYSKSGAWLRRFAASRVRAVMANPNIRTLPQTRVSFERGLRFYEMHADKAYSLTDCISMEIMHEHGLYEVLTSDHHLEQESFKILFKEKLPKGGETAQ